MNANPTRLLLPEKESSSSDLRENMMMNGELGLWMDAECNNFDSCFYIFKSLQKDLTALGIINNEIQFSLGMLVIFLGMGRGDVIGNIYICKGNST